MADEPKKIIVDDDWKSEARREKERLAAQESVDPGIPPADFASLLNLIVMQAAVGLGMLAGGPGGERIPPDLPVARHFIDLLALLEDKTRNNLTPEEKALLTQVLHDLRLKYVQLSGMMPPGAPGSATA